MKNAIKPIQYSIVLLVIILSACSPELPNESQITPITAVPTLDNVALCAIGQSTSTNWDTRIDALQTVQTRSANCETDIDLMLYLVHVERGQFNEALGDVSAAISAYQNALNYQADGTQAQERLDILQDNESTEEAPSCVDGATADALAAYDPIEESFATLGESGFEIDDSPYPIYGVNYYPLNTPFGLFLTETDLDDVEIEFDLISNTGINTLRIFLRPQDLFACDAAVPIPENFERLDHFIKLASDYDFRLIMVLNQDVIPSVLYSEDFVAEQSRFIVERYKDEPTILAWDVRDKGDVDYREGLIRQDTALRWLADTVIMIRQIDDNHPITVGYWEDSLVTAPLVDFVSFQFYGEYEDLRQEIANLRASAKRPILLTSIGYSTFTVSEVTQRNLLFQAFEEVEHNGLMGWMLNHAFDYPRTVTCIPPDCPGDGSEINQYGLWNTGYFPKLAVEAIRIATGLDE